MSQKFLFENVARYADGSPQQIRWGMELDHLLKTKGFVTAEDVESLTHIWRSGVGNAVVATGEALKKGEIIAKPVSLKGFQLGSQMLSDCMGRLIDSSKVTDINRCIEHYEINRSKARLCFFLAQIGHESAGLYYTKEIDSGWYIPRNFGLPEIAASDGGYKFRGGGYLQLSMPDNYLAFSEEYGDPDIYNLGCPYVAEKYPATSAGFWWKMNNMNSHVDRGEDMYQISGRVNCGTPNCTANGMSDRLSYYQRSVAAIPEFNLLKGES